jgi:hypothetical protein
LMSKTLRSTLMENSWFLSKSMFFTFADTQANKQADNFFPRLFSTRKRRYISAKTKDETFLC